MRRLAISAALLTWLLLIAPSATVMAQEGLDGFDEAFAQGIEAINSARYEESLQAFTRCIELRPESPTAYYNIACTFSLMKKPEKALEWLEKSLDKGFNEFAHMERDGDLDNVRKHSGYAKLVKKFSAPVLKNAIIPSFVPNRNPGAAKGLLVMLHGAGSDAETALSMWKATAKRENLILLCPQGDQQMESGGFAHGSASESVVVDAVRRWTEEHQIPADKIFLGGFSQGAAMAFQTAIRHPELFAGLVSIGGFYGIEGNEEFLDGLNDKGLKLYLIHGLDDSQTLENAREMRNLLVGDGVPAVLRRIEGGHEVNDSARNELHQAISWFLGRSDGRSQRRAF